MANGEQKGMKLLDLLKVLRPQQWTKNIVVMAAFFFAYWDPSQHLEILPSIVAVVIATLLFCSISSGIYVLNDIADVQADRNHPHKKFRPIAAGRVSTPAGWRISIILLIGGSIGASLLSPLFFFVVASYIVMQIVYSLGLKRVAFVDIVVIAAGFVLRALAGAVVLNIAISPWLLLCTFLLALFLALCKRRHEKVVFNDTANKHRPSLQKYDERLLDQMIAIISSATIVSYAIYTLSPDTIEKFDTSKLGFTIPFVVFGIFRYLDLVYRHEKGDRPEKILLTDLPLLVNIMLYGITAILVFLLQT
ncbi:decaprenyl-phosphate phosphoribosyltransferase [Verrucomicrobiota bacterium]